MKRGITIGLLVGLYLGLALPAAAGSITSYESQILNELRLIRRAVERLR